MLRKIKIPFLPKYWIRVLPWALCIALLVVVCAQYNKSRELLPPPPIDNRIDSLRLVVLDLTTSLMDARQKYDSAQKDIKVDIITIREQNAKDITSISGFTTKQLDSAWTTITFP